MMAADRRYRVVAVNMKTGKVWHMTDATLTHVEACVILSKINPQHKGRRVQLQDASDTRMVLP